MLPLPQQACHNSAFARRSNEDGTIDSICRHCFVTVATEQWETDLEIAERDHVCNPGELDRFAEFEKKAPHRAL
jgi:hypothetical protein